MQAYCDRQGFQMSTIRFVFDGNSVGPDTTPNSVSLLTEILGKYGDSCKLFSQILASLSFWPFPLFEYKKIVTAQTPFSPIRHSDVKIV